MFDIGWQELFIIAVLALLVVGPRDLPRTLRTVMSYVRKAKDMAGEFQHGINEVAQEVELDDIRKEANRIGQMDITEEVNKAVDPLGTLKEDIDMSDVQLAIQETADAMNKDKTPATSEIPLEKNSEPDNSKIETKTTG
jgi:sec-independent protein translocase protein TatB